MATHNELCGEVRNYTAGARTALIEALDRVGQIDLLVEQIKLAHAGELAQARPYTIVTDTKGEHLFIGGEHERIHIKGFLADAWKKPRRLTDCIAEGQRQLTTEAWQQRGNEGAAPHSDVIHLLDELDLIIEVNGLDTRRDNEAQPLMLNSKATISGELIGWRSITRAALRGSAARTHMNSACGGANGPLTFRDGYFLGGGVELGFADDRQGTSLLESSEKLVFKNYGFQYLKVVNGTLGDLMEFCEFLNCWSLDRWPKAMKGGARVFGGVLPPGVMLVQQVPEDWREDALAGEMEF